MDKYSIKNPTHASSSIGFVVFILVSSYQEREREQIKLQQKR
jgi:hypothetical protein